MTSSRGELLGALVVTIAMFATPTLALLKANTFGDNEQQFILGGAGRYFPNPPAGYVLATLNDIKSTNFSTFYNFNGLPDNGVTMPGFPSWCPVIAVQGGLLSFGTLADTQYLGPYGANRQLENMTQLIPPIWFGTVPADDFSRYGGYTYIGALNSTFASRLRVAPLPQRTLASGCVLDAYYAVYIRAKFVVGGWGQDFPSPPLPGAKLATVNDLRSSNFVSQYNSGRFTESATAAASAMNGCCVFNTADGYLSINRYALMPFTIDGNSACQSTSFPSGSSIWFGTSKGESIGLLNNSAVAEMKALEQLPGFCSSTTVDTWGIYKAHPAAAPPPSEGDCVEVELQASYYVPNQQEPCLADRWRHIIRLNQTYDSIAMNDYDSCGYAVSISGFSLSTYDDKNYVGATTGATQCDCSNDQALVPHESTSEMTTVCRKTINEFGFCMIEVDVDKRMKCP